MIQHKMCRRNRNSEKEKSKRKKRVYVKRKRPKEVKLLIPKQTPLDCKPMVKTVRCKLDKFLTDTGDLDIVRDAVRRGNIVMRHTCQFLKLYLLHVFQTDVTFPKVDRNLITLATKVVSTNGGRKETNYKETNLAHLSKLRQFYNSYYRQLQPNNEVILNTYLLPMLIYEGVTIETAVKNNIVAQFRKRLCQLVNFECCITKHSSTEEKRIASTVKRLIFKHDEVIPSDLNDIILAYRDSYLPKRKFTKNSVDYDLRVSTLDYLYYFFAIHRDLEQKTGKTFSVFPLKTSMVYNHVPFDTRLLKRLFGDRNISVEDFWPYYFNFDCVREPKGYTFNRYLTTDGISVGLVYNRYDYKEDTKLNIKLDEYGVNINDEQKLDTTHPNELIGKRIIAIDPNKDDIIYANDGDKTFRYTYNQKQVESKAKRYHQLRLEDKKTKYNCNGEVMDINQIEAKIGLQSSKTCDIIKYTSYVQTKNSYASLLTNHYNHNNLNYRQLRFNGYNNLKRSEDNMVNRFKRKFGRQDKTIIVFGDAGANHIKYKAPVKNKGMRELFKKHGYKVYLIDEFKTSMLCCKCLQPLENALKRPSPRPWRKEYGLVNVHGLKRCKTKNCQTYVNRDKNASQNMLTIAIEQQDGYSRPEAFCRSQQFG